MIQSYYPRPWSRNVGFGTYARPVTKSRDPHLVNVVGALALALADAIRDATEAAAGMTGAAPAAVVALQQFLRGRTTEDLAQATGLTHSGAVRLVDRLVEGGLVERRPGHDGRSLAIVLTASGRALSQKITAARANAVASALEGLRIEERRAPADRRIPHRHGHTTATRCPRPR